MSLAFLENLGLTQKEAELYELLLKLGETPANEVIKQSKLKRATAYKVLYSLEKKGLVEKKDVKKIINFRPASPTLLFNLAESQFKNLERAKKDLQAVLPELNSSYILSVEKPIIRTYEGVEGVKKAHLELLAEKSEILAYVKINPGIDTKLDRFWKEYYRLRAKNNILARVISPDDSLSQEYKKHDLEELRVTRLVPAENFQINIEKDIVGNKVAFFSSRLGKLIVTIIENEEIAQAERVIFELNWQVAKD